MNERLWAEAQDALRETVGRVTALLRAAPDPTRPALGVWNVAEVALHLSQAWVVVPGLAGGDLRHDGAVPPTLGGTAADALLPDLGDLGVVTRRGVGADPERDLGVLADRIEERAARFFAESAGTSAEEPRPWLVQGSTVARSVLTCHLLSENLVHGWDIATAAGRTWPIERSQAATVLSGFLVEVIRSLDPRALVDQRAAAGLRATYDVRLRGGDRFGLVFDDGALRIDRAPGRVDCHLSADPVAMLLVAWGRRSQWPAIATGRLVAWGPKPWLGPRLRTLMRNP